MGDLSLLAIVAPKYNAKSAKQSGETQKIIPYQKKSDKSLEIY